ncbi:unnamed protein product [Alopecurus aequalis]
MAKDARKGATCWHSLPEEIAVWEILARLPPISVLRCRAVCRAWRRTTSAHDFLLANHTRQPSLPIFSSYDNIHGVHYQNILAFHSQAATKDDQLHAVAQLDGVFRPEASCDGLLVLSNVHSSGPRLSICNPATREHALLGIPRDFHTMGMYLHHPTGEYRLLLKRTRYSVPDLSPIDGIGCYVFALGSDQPSRFIGWPETAPGTFTASVRLRDSLHWYPVCYRKIGSNLDQDEWENKLVVFDTIAESFRYMRQPIVPATSYVFDMNGMLGIYSRSRNHSSEVIDIRVLHNYESEVWDLKYRIELPVAEIKRDFADCNYNWDLDIEDRDYTWDQDVVSFDSGVLLLLKSSQWLLHIDSDGKLVNNFYHGHQGHNMSMGGYVLKQSLVQHTFFSSLQGYTVNASPFIARVSGAS